MDRGISVRDVLSDSWDLAKNNFWILIGFTVTQFVSLLIIGSLVTLVFGEASTFGLGLLTLFDAFFTVAFYQVFFKLIDQPGDAEFPDFIPNMVKALNFLIVKLIVGLGLAFASALLINLYYTAFAPDVQIDENSPFAWELLPVYILAAVGITFVTVRTSFVTCFIVDQESGSSEAISQSWALTKGHFWFVFVLYLCMLGVNILGAMVIFIGLLFTVPFSSIILIIAYRHMANRYMEEEEILLDNVEKNDGN
ncbi:DUF975 family protein [Daejeonella sp. JGW-45]|uniref:DUF975 family protein n=1 Tax=Daejeonella sp. JGW-45 TaxID=3034148 RepID=UPI0023EB3F8E|nr:DUF975 family protein [Daejeonella sp. JGW-45]